MGTVGCKAGESPALCRLQKEAKVFINDVKSIFESIICLMAEGSEFYPTGDLLTLICAEAQRGYDLCEKIEKEINSGVNFIMDTSFGGE